MGHRRPRLAARVVCTLLALSLGGLAGAPARADRTGGHAEQEADRLFKRSAEAYGRGRYAEAARLLQRAYELKPVPVLQFNLGRTLEKLARYDEALTAYQTYLGLVPDAADRADVERRIRALRLMKEVAKDALLTPDSLGGSRSARASTEPGPAPPRAAEPALASSAAPSPAAPRPAPSEPAPAPPANVAAPSPSPALVATAPAPQRRTPVYRRWWLWTTVGVVAAVGVGVGLGVGLTRGDAFSPTLAPIARP